MTAVCRRRSCSLGDEVKMFYWMKRSSSGSESLSGLSNMNMSKAEILRGIVTEKMSTAAQEILAVVERTVTGYEEEAAGLRREVELQRRQLELLLQPRVKLERKALIPDLEDQEVVVLSGEEEEEEEQQQSGVEDTGSLGLLWFDDEEEDDDGGGGDEEQQLDVALVESFIRPGNTMDGHVSCRVAPDEAAIFIEISCEVRGSLLVSAAQSHIVSLHHRKDWTLQDH
ncbi:uncharacterized protein LOC141761235 [Sebastes fasciatus]|uniref:uncharacterized protein LOC141761235 n=1 Tax=Sebastes fasciatus TaxID=394691 RepID=UPI003D9F3230